VLVLGFAGIDNGLPSKPYCGLSLFNTSSLNPVPNAQVCVFDSTYYKITTTNYISMYSWALKILMFALLVTCEIATYS
jgi:hypothetical protein